MMSLRALTSQLLKDRMRKTTTTILLLIVATMPPLGEYMKAEEPLERNLSLYSAKGSNIDSAHVHCTLGYTFLEEKNFESARIEFKKALKFDRKWAAAYNGLGLCFRHGERTTQHAIEHFQKAVSLEPNYIEAHYNLGKTYYDYKEDKLARRSFKHLIELDSDYRHACYYLGMLEKRSAVYYRSILKKSKAQEAIRWFDRQIDYDPTHVDSYLECGELYYLMEEVPKAITWFQNLTTVERDNVWADLLLGWCHYHLRLYKEAAHYFDMALVSMSEDERRCYTEPILLLSKKEEEEYHTQPEHLEEDFWRKYWKMHDPTPITDINERLVEHYFRVSYSRRYFSEGQYPWDSRGEMYIRYGEPDFRAPNFKVYPTHIQQRLEILSEVSPAVSYNGPFTSSSSKIRKEVTAGINFPNETWIYFDLIEPLGAQFVFADQSFTGKYDIPASKGEFQPAIQAQRAASEEPEVYHHDYQAEPLDFPFDMADFKGNHGKSRLEFYYGIPLGEIQQLLTEDGGLTTIETSLAIFDKDWNTMGRNEEELSFSNEISDEEKGGLAIGIFQTEMLTGTYHYAIQAKDTDERKIGIYKNTVTVHDYTSSNLMTSDLQLADSITPATNTGKFVKKGLNVIPHPGRHFERSQPVYLYFEIYNLTKDEYGRTRFRTDYTLSSLKGKKDVVSKIITEVGDMIGMESRRGQITVSYENRGTIESEIGYTGIDMKDSPPGKYSLTVVVEDLNSKKRAEKSIDFELLK